MRIVEAINNAITNSTAWVPITVATFYHVEMICQEKKLRRCKKETEITKAIC